MSQVSAFAEACRSKTWPAGWPLKGRPKGAHLLVEAFLRGSTVTAAQAAPALANPSRQEEHTSGSLNLRAAEWRQ
jgi:hypothetical protein